MTQYNTLNVKLSHSQLNKLKSGIKNGTEVTFNLSLNVIGNSNDKTNFPHELLLANTQISIICKALMMMMMMMMMMMINFRGENG